MSALFFRKTYWYASAFLKKHWPFMAGAVFVGIIVFQLLMNVLSTVLHFKKMTYIGRVGTIRISTLPRDIQEKISDGLTKIDERGNVLPALAERWSIEDDGRTYRFLLKPHLTWQDGKELKPEDISYNFSDTQVIITPNDIVFKLKDPFVPFPSVVSQPIFRENKKGIFGTGAFVMKRVRKDGSLVRELTLESASELQVYRFYPTEESAIVAFKRGEVDRLEDMTNVAELNDWKTVSITPTLRKDRYIALFYNMENPLFDKDVRQALNYALAKPKGVERALSSVNPESWAYNKTVKTYELDARKAEELLIRSLPAQPMVIELTTAANFQSEAEQIKEQWEAFGQDAEAACRKNKDVADKKKCANLALTVNLKVTSFPDVSNFQTLLVGQQIPKDPDQYYLWHSTQSTNFTHYKSPRIDKLLEDGRTTVDQAERKTIYEDFQQFLVEDSPAIFLRHLTSYVVERKTRH